jgi:hypothetical protein
MIALGKNLGQRALCALAVAGVAAVTLAPTSSVALPRYDGVWSVAIVTEKGTCDRAYRYPIRITNGRLANAGDAAFTISGQVNLTGSIRVTVSHGSSSANGSGRLDGDLGSGMWSGGACSGTWTAERRGS